MEKYNLERLAKEIVNDLTEVLDNVGLMHRIYYRCKSANSISIKMNRKKYNGKQTYMRDLIGIRINIYFIDDLAILSNHIRNVYTLKEETIDHRDETVFKPTRINYVFNIPIKNLKEFTEIVNDYRIDTTFELQLRTVLSEGWHEVEHDLRYKHSDHWQMHSDLSRVFNGILASLETNDWSMLSLIDQLAYRHYKNKNYDAMVRTKFRIRLDSTMNLSKEIINIFESSSELPKAIFRLDRKEVLEKLLQKNLRFPLTVDNLIFYLNEEYIKNTLPC